MWVWKENNTSIISIIPLTTMTTTSSLHPQNLSKKLEELKKTKTEDLARLKDLRMQWRANRKKDKAAPPLQEYVWKRLCT